MPKWIFAILAAIIVIVLIWVVRDDSADVDSSFDSSQQRPPVAENTPQPASQPPLTQPSPEIPPGERVIETIPPGATESLRIGTAPGQSGPVNALAPEVSEGPVGLPSMGQAPEASDAGIMGLPPEADSVIMESMAPEAGQPSTPGLAPEASDPGITGPAPEDSEPN